MRSGEPREHDPLVRVVQLFAAEVELMKPDVVLVGLRRRLVDLDRRPPLRLVGFSGASIPLLEILVSMLRLGRLINRLFT